MQIKEVNTSYLKSLFLLLPHSIYVNDKNWIAPLESDIENIFDATKNKNFKNGICKRWIVLDSANKPIGRIAAFVNNNYINKEDPCKVGGIGFFESIDCVKTSKLLFDTAKNWLLNNGCEAMDGPINFGERNSFWGLLIEGFKNPLYSMNYNPIYYKKLFEDYGMQIFYEQYCFQIDMKNWQQNRMGAIFERMQKNKDYEVLNLDKKKIEKFAKDFCEIYNDAWVIHEGNKLLSLEEAKKIFNSLKTVVDEKIVFFAYYKKEPIGFFVNFNLNNKFILFIQFSFPL